MPVVGQVVSVAHTSSGHAAATTTGTVWNQTNTPAEGYKGLYRKEYASQKGKAYDRYDENTGVFTQYVDKRTGRNCNGEIYDEAKGPVSTVAGGQVQITSTKSSVGLNANAGVGIIAGTSVSIEAGGFVSIEAGGGMSIAAGGDLDLSVTKKMSAEIKEGLEVEVEGGEAKITINGTVITVTEAGDVSVKSPTKIELEAPEIKATAETGDIEIQGISLVNHTHNDGAVKKPDQ